LWRIAASFFARPRPSPDLWAAVNPGFELYDPQSRMKCAREHNP
jgi:hypothetical protein